MHSFFQILMAAVKKGNSTAPSEPTPTGAWDDTQIWNDTNTWND